MNNDPSFETTLVSTPEATTGQTTQPTVKTGPSLSVDKEVYELTDVIVVTVSGTDSKDWVGIYTDRSEPGAVNATKWLYADSVTTLTFSVSELNGAGDYGVFLCDNDGYYVLDRTSIRVLSDDRADYGAAQADYEAFLENGVGKASVTITPSSEKELTYQLFWSRNGQRLADYEALSTVSNTGDQPFVVALSECLFMPAEADGVEVAVKEGLSTPFFAVADNTLKPNDSTLLYQFAVISDLHIIESHPLHINHLRSALHDIQTQMPDAQAIFTVGDNVDRGTAENYDLLMQIVGQAGKLPPIYYTLGNHDLVSGPSYNVQVELFKQYTGMTDAYYSVKIGGSTFIVLSSDSQAGGGTIGDTEMNWLRQELLNADQSRPIYLFLHHPLIDTVSGSMYSIDPRVQYWYGIDTGDIVREILKDYPQAILFSGHTHWTLESRYAIRYGHGADASFVNASSVGYLWDDNDDSVTGSEGYYIEVYEDYILLRGREFASGKWCAAAQFLFPLK